MLTMSPERLRAVVHYDPATGIIIRLRKPVRLDTIDTERADKSWNTKYGGKRAGWMHPDGYRVVTIDYIKHYAHHLAWFWVYGEWPILLDHKNGNPDDNRIDNLRECTNGQNLMNAGMWSHNTSGVKGVSRTKHGKFYAYIKKDQRMQGLGVYDTLTEAAEVRAKAEIATFGEFRRRYR